jgi:hypothetical protein
MSFVGLPLCCMAYQNYVGVLARVMAGTLTFTFG